MRKVRAVIIIICIAVMCFGLWKIYDIKSEYSQGEQSYDNLKVYVTAPPDNARGEAAEKAEQKDHSGKEKTEKEKVEYPDIDFDALHSINPGVVGWLQCEGTHIDYPIVQSSDNFYYLDHLFDNTYNCSGAIFLDRRNSGDFTDPHSIVYGHNMHNDTMFSDLVKYKEQSFYDEHTRFLLMTPEKNYTIEVFAGVVVGEQDKIWQVDFSDEIEFDQWLRWNTATSLIDTGIAPKASDRVVTFSTCSYEFQGARFVVMGILHED